MSNTDEILSDPLFALSLCFHLRISPQDCRYTHAVLSLADPHVAYKDCTVASSPVLTSSMWTDCFVHCLRHGPRGRTVSCNASGMVHVGWLARAMPLALGLSLWVDCIMHTSSGKVHVDGFHRRTDCTVESYLTLAWSTWTGYIVASYLPLGIIGSQQGALSAHH